MIQLVNKTYLNKNCLRSYKVLFFNFHTMLVRFKAYLFKTYVTHKQQFFNKIFKNAFGSQTIKCRSTASSSGVKHWWSEQGESLEP